MSDPQTLLELAAQAEKATRPDRELDAEIVVALDLRPQWAQGGKLWIDQSMMTIHGHHHIRHASGKRRSKGDPSIGRARCFTSSLDAVMTLADGMADQVERLLIEAIYRLREAHHLPALAPKDYAQALAAFFTAACLRAKSGHLQRLDAGRSAMTTQDEKGWIEWSGGECPVEPKVVVDYVIRSESLDDYEPDPLPAEMLDWQHEGRSYDIVAYRVVKP